MKRKCPNCGENGVPILKLALLGEVSKMQCSSCHSKIEVSHVLSVASFYLVNILMLGVLLWLIELVGFWGVPLAFFMWVLAEIVRSIYLPLKAGMSD